MATPVSSIVNIGPATEQVYNKAGLVTAEQIIEMGADAAYSILIRSGVRPHFIGYYALVLGLQGRPWSDCGAQEKLDLRKRFDDIKSATNRDNQSDLQSELKKLCLL